MVERWLYPGLHTQALLLHSALGPHLMLLQRFAPLVPAMTPLIQLLLLATG